jgi:calcium-dependent protein kinase
MNSVDLDGNGTIDYNEFLAATMNRTKIMSKQNLEAAFKMFDKVCSLFNITFRTEVVKSA